MALEASAQRGRYVHGVCERLRSRAESGLGWIKEIDQQSRPESCSWRVGEAKQEKVAFSARRGRCPVLHGEEVAPLGAERGCVAGLPRANPNHSRCRGEAGGSVHFSPKGSGAWSGSWERGVIKTE